jgi:hypothetical protein
MNVLETEIFNKKFGENIIGIVSDGAPVLQGVKKSLKTLI